MPPTWLIPRDMDVVDIMVITDIIATTNIIFNQLKDPLIIIFYVYTHAHIYTNTHIQARIHTHTHTRRQTNKHARTH